MGTFKNMDIDTHNAAAKRHKVQLHTHVSPDAKALLERTAKQRGITMTAILEQAIRDYAASFGITTPEETTS